MFFKGRLKAQSAMEYLMTYGWAILIIAIVLGALFSLGVFNSSSFIGTTCIPSSGFFCSNPSLRSGTFTVTLGQETGTSWTTANVVFISGGGSPVSVASTPTSSGTGTCAVGNPSGLSSGQTFVATLTGYASTASAVASNGVVTCTGLSTAVGSSISGALWMAYQPAGISGIQWNQIAVVTLKGS